MFKLKNSVKSLDNILSGFTKTLEELNSFVTTKKVDKAESVIKNINSIIGK